MGEAWKALASLLWQWDLVFFTLFFARQVDELLRDVFASTSNACIVRSNAHTAANAIYAFLTRESIARTCAIRQILIILYGPQQWYHTFLNIQ